LCDFQQTVPSASARKRHSSALPLIIFLAALAAMALVFHLLTGGMFLEAKNAQIVLANSIYPTFVSWGLCFLFACGYTDLSIGGVVVLASFATCVCGNLLGYPGVLLGGFVAGTFMVFLNFTIFAFTKIPSWIASISLALIYEAIAVFLRADSRTGPYINAELSRDYRAIGQMPMNVIWLVAGFVIVFFVYNNTNICLNIRAVGGNKEVARALGVDVMKTLLWVGLICGLLIGAASVLQQSYNIKTVPMASLTSIQMIYKPLAIALLAQILQKKINIIVAVPFCSLIIYSVFSVMTFFGIPSGTFQDVLLCVFLVLFGIGGQRGVKGVVK
jgi:ribose transport system permease protein